MSRRALGLVLCAVAWGAMVAYVVVEGLDRADKVASVAGALIGLAGLVLALLPRGAASTQRVTGSQIGGSVDLAGAEDQRVERSTVRRSVRMRRGRP